MGGVQASPPKHLTGPPLTFHLYGVVFLHFSFWWTTVRDLSTDNCNLPSRWLTRSNIKSDTKIENWGPEMVAPKQEIGASCSSLLFSTHTLRYDAPTRENSELYQYFKKSMANRQKASLSTSSLNSHNQDYLSNN